MAGRRLEVEIIGDSRSLERAFGRSAKAGGDFGSKLARGAKVAAIGIAGVAVAGSFLGKRMIDLASDAAEVESKFKVIFGKEMPGMVKNIDAFSKATGASRYELRAQVADMGALLEPLTASKKAAGDMSVQFTKLATDLGSFNNVPTADALLAIRSGLVGEAEPLRRFGVLLNEAAVKAEAYRSGIAKAGSELTEQQKVQARANLIMQQTTLAQGDAERTSGSMANQMKALSNNLKDMGTSIGAVLLPYMLQLVTWVNENMPTIQRVMETSIKGVVAVIEFLAPIIGKVIGWFQRLASFARRHWGEVQAAALVVLNWYRGTLAPAIGNVLIAIQAFWDRFGSAITRIVRTSLGLVLTVVKTILGNLGSIIEGILAVLRGDWGKAWDEFKEIPRRTLNAAIAIIKGLASIFLTAAKALGAALIDGIIAGLSGLADMVYDMLKDAIGSGIDRVKGFFGIGSPSKVTAAEIGVPLGEGIIVGLNAALTKMPEAMRDKMTAAVEAGAQAIESGKSRFSSAFDALTSTALSAFDKLAGDIETKTEKKIRLQDERRANADRQRALRDANAGLAGARSEQAAISPEQFANLNEYLAAVVAAGEKVKAAEQAKRDALFAIQRAEDEKVAAQERKKLDERMALKRRHFEEEFAALQNSYQRGKMSATAFHQKLVDLFKEYHIPYKKGATALGAALAEGLYDSFKNVEKAAKALAKAILDQFSKIKIIINVDLSVKTGQKPGGRQHGGPVRAGSPYVVGEAGPELFVPGASGRIIPNGGGMVGAASAASEVHVHFHGGTFLGGNKERLALDIRDALVRAGIRNSGQMMKGLA